LVASLGALGASVLSHQASAGNAVQVVVLLEHGQGTTSMVQPYLTKFVGLAANLNGWDPASDGKYFTSRGQADAWIKSTSPHYGILSLAAYYGLKSTYNLEVVGEAQTNVGGQQYFIASLNQGSLGDCKGKKLSSDHAGTPADVGFIDGKVAGGAFKIGDFTLVPFTRFGQAGNEMLNGNADCALINDAQLTSLQKTNSAVKTVWSSAKLPGMPLVAFPSAPAAEKAAFQASLPKICPSNPQVCADVGVVSLTSASNARYP
jgi:ABC-type amino acid transport substrate-binding protein